MTKFNFLINHLTYMQIYFYPLQSIKKQHNTHYVVFYYTILILVTIDY